MTAAFILLQLEKGADAYKVHDALHTIAGVKTVHFMAGPTDGIMFVEVADQAALLQTIGKVRATAGVASTDTRIVWGG